MATDLSIQQPANETPLEILIVEDSQGDFELTVGALVSDRLKVNVTSAKSREEFENSITSKAFDVVISDYNLRSWTGMDALNFLKEKNSDAPFILVSGAVGDETAAQCIKDGVTEFISKMHLGALPAAVRRAISEKSIHAARKRAEALLRESEATFRVLADSIASAILIYQGTKCRYANRAAQNLTGYSEEELLGLDSWDLFHPDSHQQVIESSLSRAKDTNTPIRFEAKVLTKQGEVRFWDITLGGIQMESFPAGLFTALDVTERSLAEKKQEFGGFRDSLTGLLSSRQARNVFLGEAKRSQRTGRSFAVLALKCEDWKEIQEKMGQVEASQALCKLAKLVGEICRSADSPSRFSDDEFVVILPETSLAGVRRLTQRFSDRLGRELSEVPFTVSIGLALFPQEGPTMDHTLRAAHKNLRSFQIGSKPKQFVQTA